MFGGDFQQHLGRARGFAAALLPILERVFTDAQQPGKLISNAHHTPGRSAPSVAIGARHLCRFNDRMQVERKNYERSLYVKSEAA
jgi:hypothetical protein